MGKYKDISFYKEILENQETTTVSIRLDAGKKKEFLALSKLVNYMDEYGCSIREAFIDTLLNVSFDDDNVAYNKKKNSYSGKKTKVENDNSNPINSKNNIIEKVENVKKDEEVINENKDEDIPSQSENEVGGNKEEHLENLRKKLLQQYK